MSTTTTTDSKMAATAEAELRFAAKRALFALGECSIGRERLSDHFPVTVQLLRNALAKYDAMEAHAQ